METLAGDAGVPLPHLALGWLASRPEVASVIAGATKPEQVRANVEATLWEPEAVLSKRISASTDRPRLDR